MTNYVIPGIKSITTIKFWFAMFFSGYKERRTHNYSFSRLCGSPDVKPGSNKQGCVSKIQIKSW